MYEVRPLSFGEKCWVAVVGVAQIALIVGGIGCFGFLVHALSQAQR